MPAKLLTPTLAPLAYGSVCSGIEAVSLAWQPLGFTPAWFAEIDPFPCAVLSHHYPDVPNLGDMTQIAKRIRARTVPAPDILVGGTPCQSFSIAGDRRGLDDPRGALTLSFVEIANALDQIRLKNHTPPTTLIWENVPGVLSDRSNAFGCFLAALAGESRPLQPPGPKWTHAGCVSGPRRRIAWRVLDAQYFGVAQRRRRVFLVASGRDDLDPAQILFESDGLPRHPAQNRAPWQNTAGSAASDASVPSDYTARSAYEQLALTVGFGGGNTSGPIDVAACLLAAPGSKHDFDVETFLVQSLAGHISPTLDTANGGKGSSEDGTGKGVPIVAVCALPALAFAQNSRNELRWESGHGQLCGALSTGGGKAGQGQPVVLSLTWNGRLDDIAAHSVSDTAMTLRTARSSNDKVCFIADSLEAHFLYTPNPSDDAAWWPWHVRRLMPVECERLQGMPDDYTLVPYRGKPAADAPRYKAIGNSMAVPCMAWIGERLRQVLLQIR